MICSNRRGGWSDVSAFAPSALRLCGCNCHFFPFLKHLGHLGPTHTNLPYRKNLRYSLTISEHFQHLSNIFQNFYHLLEFLAFSRTSSIFQIFQHFLEFLAFSRFSSILLNFLEFLAFSRISSIFQNFQHFLEFLAFSRISSIF